MVLLPHNPNRANDPGTRGTRDSVPPVDIAAGPGEVLINYEIDVLSIRPHCHRLRVDLQTVHYE